ncbi:unnamed protein product [Linum tenue]|nr:unnamed protein product [Linum tenue]
MDNGDENKGNDRLVSWKAPDVGWIKVNVDGSRYEANCSTAIGGVLRDCCGNWIAGFANSFGFTTIVTAEVRAIRDGLSLAQLLGYKKVEVESDSQVAVQLICQLDTENHPLDNLLRECRQLLKNNGEYTINHIFREANVVADAMAKKGHAMFGGEELFSSPPTDIVHLVEGDIAGIQYARPG